MRKGGVLSCCFQLYQRFVRLGKAIFASLLQDRPRNAGRQLLESKLSALFVMASALRLNQKQAPRTIKT
ncbi:GRIP domain-containing protein [Fusarium oxysporum f. sp. albedinis]|nr:GRIP domain-containing protein [Fusarium oxysporum f. sp. albedinis]